MPLSTTPYTCLLTAAVPDSNGGWVLTWTVRNATGTVRATGVQTSLRQGWDQWDVLEAAARARMQTFLSDAANDRNAVLQKLITDGVIL